MQRGLWKSVHQRFLVQRIFFIIYQRSPLELRNVNALVKFAGSLFLLFDKYIIDMAFKFGDVLCFYLDRHV